MYLFYQPSHSLSPSSTHFPVASLFVLFVVASFLCVSVASAFPPVREEQARFVAFVVFYIESHKKEKEHNLNKICKKSLLWKIL